MFLQTTVGVFNSIIKIIMAVIVMVVPVTQSDYSIRLQESGLFVNMLETALPQAIVADMVRDHFHAPVPAGKTVKKCAVIGLDGVRCDTLIHLKDDAQSGIRLLAAQGGLYVSIAGGDTLLHTQATKTTSGWTTILTGKWANTHLVFYNGMIKLLSPKTILTELVEDGSANSAAFYTWWPWHVQKVWSTYGIEAAYTKFRGLPVSWNTLGGEDELRAALPVIAAKPDCPDILFSIFERPDETGHQFGFSNDVPEYVEAVRGCDRDAYDIIKTIQARESYASEDWLIIMTSDHGGQGKDHGNLSEDCRMTFIATNKAITVNE